MRNERNEMQKMKKNQHQHTIYIVWCVCSMFMFIFTSLLLNVERAKKRIRKTKDETLCFPSNKFYLICVECVCVCVYVCIMYKYIESEIDYFIRFIC